MGEYGQDLKFVCMFYQETGIGILPGIIYEDNEGAIFLAKNQQVGMRTKHIDVKYHFIRDLVQDNYLDIRYVRSEEHYAGVLTKNVSEEIHNSQAVLGRNPEREYRDQKGECRTY